MSPLTTQPPPLLVDADATEAPAQNYVTHISLGLIDPPPTPSRLDYDAVQLSNLADSLRDNGLINPITVHPNGDRYTIVAGDMRTRAARQLGWTTIPAIVRDPSSIQITTMIRIAENIQRSDLSPIEESLELYRLHNDQGLSVDAIAKLVRRRREWVTQRLALLELPDDLTTLVHSRRLALGAALALARCADDAHRAYLTQYALEEGATVHAIAMWIESWRLQKAANPNTEPVRPTPGEPLPVPVIHMPCSACRELTDHRELALLRTCKTCTASITEPPPL